MNAMNINKIHSHYHVHSLGESHFSEHSCVHHSHESECQLESSLEHSASFSCKSIFVRGALA